MMKLVTAFILVFLMLPVVASEAVKGAKKDLDKFKQDMSVELKQIENDLKVMATKAEKKSDQTYRTTVKELTATRDKLRSELYEMEADAKGEWKEAKSELSTSLDKLHAKIQQALKD